MMLQGTMKPPQLISLFDIGGPTIKMANHADHLHIGYPAAGREGPGGVRGAVIKRRDWFKLIDRLGEIDNPAVGKKPSKYALPSRASRSHRGD
jgi:hypothetical protein